MRIQRGTRRAMAPKLWVCLEVILLENLKIIEYESDCRLAEVAKGG